MNIDFYKVTYKLFINNYPICRFSDIKLIHNADAKTETLIIQGADWNVLKKYDFVFSEDKRGKYICESYFRSYSIDIPKCLQGKQSFWNRFSDSRPRIYFDQIETIKEEVDYKSTKAPQINELGAYPADLVIEYFRERGLSFCPIS